MDTITADMIIGDIVSLFPEASDIMLSYGLHCVGCHVNVMETLEQGMMGHGFAEDDLRMLLEELNEAYVDYQKESSPELHPLADEMKLLITDKALDKISSVADAENKKDQYLLIKTKRNFSGEVKFAMDFVPQVGQFDKVFSFRNDSIKILLDKRYYAITHPLQVDYLIQDDKQGFKIKQVKDNSILDQIK